MLVAAEVSPMNVTPTMFRTAPRNTPRTVKSPAALGSFSPSTDHPSSRKNDRRACLCFGVTDNVLSAAPHRWPPRAAISLPSDVAGCC